MTPVDQDWEDDHRSQHGCLIEISSKGFSVYRQAIIQLVTITIWPWLYNRQCPALIHAEHLWGLYGRRKFQNIQFLSEELTGIALKMYSH